MNYLQKDKLSLHLKIGRKLFQFVGLGRYFESKTFEYLELAKEENVYSVKLVQVLDYMYGFSPSMEEFKTVEELESECEYKFEGSLEDCLEWANIKYRSSSDKWTLDLVDIYMGYVEKEILGQGGDST